MNERFSLTSIPPEDEALRAPVREFLREALGTRSAAVRARSWMGFDADFSRAMAERGWVGMTLPKAYGGGGRSPFARFVLVEELLSAGAPVSAHWIADRQSGPLIVRYGTEAQKAFYLPKVCAAQAFFCIGMSEPNSGSDLASIRTRAVRTERGWGLTGRKIWTTNAHKSNYMIALVRTSGGPDDRQRGLSQVIVDLSLPGVTISPIEDIAGDRHFSEVTFDDVPLKEDALIGTEGSGWEQVTAELAFERSGPERIYSSVVLFEQWMKSLKAAEQRGEVISDSERRALGALISELATLRELSLSLTGRLAAGESPVTEAALVKDLGTTFEQSTPTVIGDLAGMRVFHGIDSDLADTLAYVTKIAPSFSLRGGTREILRGMIARGLGLR
jgi:alkylation response protein AidB-like acyl-CoA dehydrogenase